MTKKLKSFLIGIVVLTVLSITTNGCNAEKGIKDAGEAIKKTFEKVKKKMED